MKTVLILCFAAAAFAAPSHENYSHHRLASDDDKHHLRELPAVRHEESRDEYGQYALRYITAEDTVVSERGYLVPAVNGTYVMVIEGQYQYVGDDGNIYVTKYHAGPDGFHVDGDHLPQPVPMPAI